MRQRCEVVVHQHELRDGPCRCAPSSHRDAHIGVLEGEQIVHTVSGHSHDVPLPLQGLHNTAFLFRCDSSEDRRCIKDGSELVEVNRKRTGVESSVTIGNTGLGRNGRDRHRVVTGHDLHRDALIGEKGDGLFDVWFDLLGQLHERNTSKSRGQRVRRRKRLIAQGKEQHSSAAPSAHSGLHEGGPGFVALVAEDELGSTENPGSTIKERRARPLPLR